MLPILHNSKWAETSRRILMEYLRNIGANNYQRGPTRRAPLRMAILPWTWISMDTRPKWIGFGYAFLSMGSAQTRPDCSWVGHGYNLIPVGISKPDPIVWLDGQKSAIPTPQLHVPVQSYTLLSKTCKGNYTIPVITFISWHSIPSVTYPNALPFFLSPC